MDGESLVAVDVGWASTRAVLFDVVEGEYRFIAAGQAESTLEAPEQDASLGVRNALANLSVVVGRTLLDGSRTPILPVREDGSGFDAMVVTISAGPPVSSVIVGLLSDVSLESARRLVETSYNRVHDIFGLDDHRRPDRWIDELIRIQPDLVVIAGGTDGGASRSVQKMLEPVGLASHLTPPEKRPVVLFSGNSKMETEVKSLLSSQVGSLQFSPNIRPSLETEDLEPAARILARLSIDIRKKQNKGIEPLENWSNGHILPTGYALGRMMRFLSAVYAGSRGILCVDLGASAAIISAGFKEKAVLGVYPQFGLGENISGILNHTTAEEILRWSPVEVSPSSLKDFLHQKSLYPGTISATREDQAMVHALSRQALNQALKSAQRSFPPNIKVPGPGLLPLFDPILACGSALSDLTRPGVNLLLILDALQPVGVASVILDQNDLLPLLGAAAEHNPLIPVQVLESGAFLSAGTIIAPVVSANFGATILKARLIYADSTEARAEIKFGGIQSLPLPSGQTGRLMLQPLRGADVGFGPGRSGTLQVSGGALGVVFDGRGRPIQLPSDPGRRRDLIRKWQLALGGA
jgi:hypothetical protein